MSSEDIYKTIYDNNIWNDPLSRSGTGSNLKETKTIREIIPTLIDRLNISTCLDLPCGDFYWMKEIQSRLNLISYVGGDIVDDLIELNNKNYSNGIFSFKKLDILNSVLPKTDLIFCRDCLVHFSYEDILKALKNLKKSKSKYLITTSFPGRINKDIISDNWRPIDLQKFPFYLPKPLETHNENCTEFSGKFSDKSLVLFEIKNLKLIRFKTALILLTIFRKLRSTTRFLK